VTHQNVKLEDIKKQVVKMSASILFVPLYSSCSYKERIDLALARILTKLKIKRVVFGDLHLESIRSWREKNFKQYIDSFSGKMYFPLWNCDYEILLDSLEDSGATSYISAIECAQLKASIAVGDEFNRKLYDSLPDSIDGFGEDGEFHTLVDPPKDFMK
jgi:ATP-binding cassette subfamily B (MDR/TAP) protein 1